jgi:hypothetical protein
MTNYIRRRVDDAEGAHRSTRDYDQRDRELEEGEVLDNQPAERRLPHSTIARTLQHYSPPPIGSERAEPYRRHRSGRETLEHNFEQTRNELDHWMQELNWLHPTGRGWLYSTEIVEVGDMVHVPWSVVCKDRNVIVTCDHT